jgi:hypothetical protein
VGKLQYISKDEKQFVEMLKDVTTKEKTKQMEIIIMTFPFNPASIFYDLTAR